MYKQIGKTASGCAIATIIGFALPKATSAQVTDISAPLAGETRLIAQAISPDSPSLLASGYGRAFAPADQAAIVLSYALNYYPEISEDSTSPPQPPVAKPSDLDAIVSVLAASVGRNAITVSRDPYSYQSLRLVVRVDSPTRERISALIDLAETTAAQNDKFIASSTGVIYTARDCQTAENTARQAAVDEARRQITALANAVGVQAGDLLSASGSVAWTYSPPSPEGCPSNLDDILSYAGLYGVQFYDPSLPPQVPVDVNVSLTYEIRE